MSDLIDRQAAIDAALDAVVMQLMPSQTTPDGSGQFDAKIYRAQKMFVDIGMALYDLPSVQLEPLTDLEQQIFLAAMDREEKVCEEVDRSYAREPYEDSLMRVCKETRRKVKGALWT